MNYALPAAALAIAVTGSATAGTVTLQALDVRGTGVFGTGDDQDPTPGVYVNHQANTGSPDDVTLNGGALPGAARTPNDPIDIAMTYNNLDLDGDGTPNDSVSFTLNAIKFDFDGDGNEGGFLASFGQGIDTGFGSLQDIEIRITNVSGTTTDSGANILFDGFTGVNLGAGSSGAVLRSAEINGTLVSFDEPSLDPPGFQFFVDGVDFAEPTDLVQIGNSNIGGTGSIVARSYDLQFSTEMTGGGLSADFNQDGTVDLLDLDILGANWQMAGTATTGDANGDGTVDLLDLDELGSQWQMSASFESALAASGIVPEPASLALLGLGSLLVARRRR